MDGCLTSQLLIDNAWRDRVLGVYYTDKHGQHGTGEVKVDTDYQYIFSILNEISDDLEDKGCLGRPWGAQQLENVSASQAAVQKIVNRRTTTEDVIDGTQQSCCGLGRWQSRANRQDLLRRLDGYT